MKRCRHILLTLIFGFSCQITFSQSSDEKVMQQVLNNLVVEKTQEQESSSLKVLQYAERNNLPIWYVDQQAHIVQLVDIDEYGNPVYRTTMNEGAGRTTGARILNAQLGVMGEGITAGVWDSGPVFQHAEFTSRASVFDGGATSDHATHVAGTIMAAGINELARGMAPKASVISYNWDNDIGEMAGRATSDENSLLFSNHSYGLIHGWFLNSQNRWQWSGTTSISDKEDFRFGFYGALTKSIDELAFNAPYYSIFWAAGNDRDDVNTTGASSGNFPPDCNGGTGFDCITLEGTAKNIITVGAVKKIENYNDPSSVELAGFSNWGPTDDGRIKPDFVAAGVDLLSSVSTPSGQTGSRYSSFSGTSMATPNALGSMVLLQELFIKKNAKPMRAATLKALAVHTVKEAGPAPGPDYMNGWGLLDVNAAAKIIDRADDKEVFINELTLVQGATIEIPIFPAINTKVTATIAWTDPSGTLLANGLDVPTPMLVNDLDVRLENEVGTCYFPWMLDPTKMSTTQVAIRGDNYLDNVEKLEFDLAEPRAYTLKIQHKGILSGGSQKISLILTYTKEEPTGTTFYWINGQGDWNDPSHWALSSGGVSSNTLPGNDANIIVDENSLSKGQEITLTGNESCRSLSWFEKDRTILDLNGKTLNIAEDIKVLSDSFLVSGKGTLHFENPANKKLWLSSAGMLDAALEFYNVLGQDKDWKISGSPSIGSVNLVSGKLDFSNATLTIEDLVVDGPSAVTELDLTNATILGIKNISLASPNLILKSSVTTVLKTSADSVVVDLGSKKLNGKLQVESLLCEARGQGEIGSASLSGKLLVNGALKINDFKIFPASHLQLVLGKSLSLTSKFDIQSSNQQPVIISSSGSSASLFFEGYHKLCFNFLNITNVNITGKAIINAGENSTLVNAQNWRSKKCEDVIFPDFSVQYNCQNSLIEFTDKSSGNISGWTWTLPGASTSFGQNSSVARAIFKNSGTIDVTLSVHNDKGTERITRTVDITSNQSVTNTITMSGENLFSSQTGDSYQWFRNNELIAGANSRVYNFKGEAGSYIVTATNGACNIPSQSFIVTSAEDILNTNLYLIYPNPTQKMVNVDAQYLPASISVYDAQGRELKSSWVKKELPMMDLDGIGKGVYILVIRTGSRVLRTKLILQ